MATGSGRPPEPPEWGRPGRKVRRGGERKVGGGGGSRRNPRVICSLACRRSTAAVQTAQYMMYIESQIFFRPARAHNGGKEDKTSS